QIETAGRRDAPELEIVQDGQFRKDVAPLWNVTDAGADQLARRMVGYIPAVIEYPALTDRQHPKRGLERGRLAGAVRTNHRGDCAAPDVERKPAQNRFPAVAGDDILEAQDVVSGQDKPRSLSGPGGCRRDDRPR